MSDNVTYLNQNPKAGDTLRLEMSPEDIERRRAEIQAQIQSRMDATSDPIELNHWEGMLLINDIEHNPKTSAGMLDLSHLCENTGLTQSNQVATNVMTLTNSLRFAQLICHAAAVKSGWWHDLKTGETKLSTYPNSKVNVAEKLMLIVSELGEAMEADRKGARMDDHLPELFGLEAELADVVIRCFDLAGGLDLDIVGAIVMKLAYNQQRADHKVENRKADDGKKY